MVARDVAPNGQLDTLAVATDPDVPNIVYVGGFNRFARSVDAGLTWQELRPFVERPDWLANALLADPRRAGTLLMSTVTQGLAEITIAPNLVLESGAAPLSPVAPGAQATYRYRLQNLGQFHATGARTAVTLPADATGIAATITNGACLVQGTTVTCTTPVLEAAATTDIVVSSAHPAAGTIQVLASVRGDQPDPQAADDEVRYTVTVAQPVTPPPPPPPAPPPSGGGGGGGTSFLALAACARRTDGSFAATPDQALQHFLRRSLERRHRDVADVLQIAHADRRRVEAAGRQRAIAR